MGLHREYESIRAAFLHCSPLPSFDAVVQEILFEEKRLGINLSNHFDVVLASTYPPTRASSTFWHSCSTLHPYTSQQNGRAERKHRHILDSVRTLLLSTSCPKKFWGEATLTSVYTINRLPSSILENISPFERLYGTPPNYFNLKVFCCAFFVLSHLHEHTKLEPRAASAVFLAMAQNIKVFIVGILFPIDFKYLAMSHFRSTLCSHLSSFHTSFSSSHPFFTDSSVELFPLYESTYDLELTQSAPAPTNLSQSFFCDDGPKPTLDTPYRRSTRVREPLIHLQDYHCFSNIVSLVEPTSYQETSTEYSLCQKAMNDELQALEKTHTLDYVNLPLDKRPIDCKNIFSYGSDDVCSQFIIVDAKQWHILQMDVKNAFLNGILSEEVYMKPPHCTSPPPHKVCFLRRALCGLKQVSQAWFATFSSTITQLGFTSSPNDTVLFTCHTPQAKYVSDLLARSEITDSNTASMPLDLNVYLTPYDGVPLEDETLGHGLQFSSQSFLVLSGYSDVDWAGNPTDRHSTTGSYSLSSIVVPSKLLTKMSSMNV
ncbi:Retrovirus-related Pol polyprotein from transposon TNT 1-94 [Cucumis melo var. makuwa]|uniref:Retrovirus-related Pol polyprotein from transposon TNT 1-94 n=1 Tax=Cucumis melo var. makuwa TaxID=1194695 RepID=A0A5D3CE55_CUCMM|nr:Retrovirus-related Pol polyprotein from transposon TNT 1-94 [Cucumis melo var. makuwa]